MTSRGGADASAACLRRDLLSLTRRSRNHWQLIGVTAIGRVTHRIRHETYSLQEPCREKSGHGHATRAPTMRAAWSSSNDYGILFRSSLGRKQSLPGRWRDSMGWPMSCFRPPVVPSSFVWAESVAMTTPQLRLLATQCIPQAIDGSRVQRNLGFDVVVVRRRLLMHKGSLRQYPGVAREASDSAGLRRQLKAICSVF